VGPRTALALVSAGVFCLVAALSTDARSKQGMLFTATGAQPQPAVVADATNHLRTDSSFGVVRRESSGVHPVYAAPARDGQRFAAARNARTDATEQTNNGGVTSNEWLAAGLLVSSVLMAFWAKLKAASGVKKPLLAGDLKPMDIALCTTSGEVSDEIRARAESVAKAQQREEERSQRDPLEYRARPFPLSMVLGCEEIKTALLLATINPNMGGVCISGGRGTAKSVMAKGLYKIMPPIERIKGSPFNIDPTRPYQVDDFTARMLEETGQELSDLETEVIDCPFVQVPLNIMEDRLLGSVDVEESVRQGKTVFQPGLLAKAHRGILYVDDINLLDDELCNILFTSLAEGWVNVEREGVSVRFPCKPLLVATFNPEETGVRDHVLDRMAVCLNVDAQPLNLEQRVEAMQGVLDWSNFSDEELMEIDRQEQALTTRILFSREYFKSEVKCSTAQIKYLCEEATRAGCQGQRAEIFAAEVAKASAALEERPVNADDLALAVKLVITPRSSYMQMDEPPPPPPPPPPEEENQEPEGNADEDDEENEDEKDEEEQEQEEEEEQEDDSIPDIPQEFFFDADTGVPMDPELLNFADKAKTGKSGGRGLIFSQERGRYIKPMLPKGKVKRLAVDATMRAAAPFQRGRRERAESIGNPKNRKVFIEKEDVRTKRMARPAGCLIIFCVDASGSMALNRMDAAKGAAISLLETAYQSRDKVCVIPFQGDKAEVLLPPTKSIAMARDRLESMPCGGGSPLASAINTAVRTGLNAMSAGDVGQVIVVLCTDGRANVPLSAANPIGEEDPEEKPSMADIKEEVLDAAKQLGAIKGFNLLVLDSEEKFVSTGVTKEIAAAARGTYKYLPKLSGNNVANVTQDAIAEARAAT
jgi:magnesium chelatase subunit D